MHIWLRLTGGMRGEGRRAARYRIRYLARGRALDEVLHVGSVGGPIIAKHAPIGVWVQCVVHTKALQPSGAEGQGRAA